MTKIKPIKYLLGFLILSTFLIYLVEQNSVADHTSTTDITSSTDSSIDNPVGLAIHNWHFQVYVGNSDSDKITIVNGSDPTIVSGTISSVSNPTDLAVNEYSGRLYAINSDSNTVKVYNTNNNHQLLSTITVGSSPGGIDTSDYSGRAYVTNTGSNTLSLYDEADSSVTTITGFNQPKGIAVNKYYDEAYVANSGADTLAVYGPYLDEDSIFLQNTVGDNPVDVSVNEETDLIFVISDGASDSIAVIDSATLDFNDLSTLTLTSGSNPTGLAVNVCRDELYVANSGTNNVEIYDTSDPTSLTLSHTISVNAPNKLIVDEFFRYLYVTRSSSDTVSVFTINGCPGPEILSITASDPNGGADTGYSAGDVIVVRFDEFTNMPFAASDLTLTRAQVDNLFTFSQSLSSVSGDSGYTGRWFNPSVFIITINDPGTANPTIGSFTMTVKSGAALTNAWFSSNVSTDTSPTLGGSFGQRVGPSILDIVAFDPDEGTDTNYSAGDKIAVVFDEETNAPFSGTDDLLTRSELDSLFTFSENLSSVSGESYTGQWVGNGFLIITINDPGTANPTIGSFTMTVKAGANLKDELESSAASISQSLPLSGTFGPWTSTISVSDGGEATETTPSGITVSMDLPSGVTDSVSFDETTASEVGPNGEELEFIGNPVEIETSNDSSCLDGCTASFTVTDEQLEADGLTLDDLRIYHDINNDGDFADANEVITPTITPSSAPGPYTVSGTATSTSKFAIGGVRVLGLGGVGDIFPPTVTMSNTLIDSLSLPEDVRASIVNQGPDNPILPSNIPSVDYPLTIDDKGFILTSYSNTILTNTVETGKPVNLKLLLSENSGLSSVEHVALYTNLRGLHEEVAASNTYIIYEKGKQLQITDPNGFFSKVDLVTSQVGNKLQLSFDITFEKSMETSHIILRSWDERRNSGDTKIYNAIKVVEGYQEDTLQNKIDLHDIDSTESVADDSQKEELLDLMPTIKKWGGYSAESASNTDLLKEIGIDAEYMPSWTKKLSRWVINEDITQEEFISVIKYLHEKGIVT